MKHIEKHQEPQTFTDWKARANDAWLPTYADLSGETKQSVKNALMVEQGYICCYCERRLARDDSHIEHFRPQSDPAVNPLDYSNMLCSCQNRLRKGAPRHCGNLKDNWFDEELLISPIDPTCEGKFAFTGDGGIKPSAPNDAAASMTITKLGLDIPKLRDLRNKAIEPFLDAFLTEDDMRRFVSGGISNWTTLGCMASSGQPFATCLGAMLRHECVHSLSIPPTVSHPVAD